MLSQRTRLCRACRVSLNESKYCEKIQQAEAKLLSNYIFLPMILDPFETNVKPWVKNFATNIDLNWHSLLDMYIVKH